jgi:hypothetical protein
VIRKEFLLRLRADLGQEPALAEAAELAWAAVMAAALVRAEVATLEAVT